MGRPRKFTNRDIVTDGNELFVIVDHRLRGTKAEYRVIPMNDRIERFGRARWEQSADLQRDPKGRKSSKGSITVYRANQFLDAELGDRGCGCQCCAHHAIPYSELSWRTGDYKEAADD